MPASALYGAADSQQYLATVDRTEELARLQAQAQRRKPMLVFGPEGVGKTRLIEASHCRSWRFFGKFFTRVPLTSRLSPSLQYQIGNRTPPSNGFAPNCFMKKTVPDLAHCGTAPMPTSTREHPGSRPLGRSKQAV